jgi:hypothetical protein
MDHVPPTLLDIASVSGVEGDNYDGLYSDSGNNNNVHQSENRSAICHRVNHSQPQAERETPHSESPARLSDQPSQVVNDDSSASRLATSARHWLPSIISAMFNVFIHCSQALNRI